MTGHDLARILYVEDDADIQSIAVLALETVGGFTLCACSSGQEAVAAASAFEPDCILLDVMMPGMDGPATLAALRAVAATTATPAIFMTAKVHPAEVEQLKRLGAIGVIPKPFDAMTLATQVRDLWNSARG